MAGGKGRPFDCTTVNEQVMIKLTSRRIGGFSGHTIPFIQCNQNECQYVDDNEPPCPLVPDLFAEELAEQARRRSENYDY